jgi:hypothetical protein
VLVTAPKCVFAGFFTQKTKDGSRTVVHLLNGTNTTTGHGSKNEKEFAFREETLPVRNIKVAFAGEKPAKIELIPQHIELPCSKNGDGMWEAIVPEVGVHVVLSAQYSK